MIITDIIFYTLHTITEKKINYSNINNSIINSELFLGFKLGY